MKKSGFAYYLPYLLGFIALLVAIYATFNPPKFKWHSLEPIVEDEIEDITKMPNEKIIL